MPDKRRVSIILVTLFSVFLLLNIKFIYLQLICHRSYYREAAEQRSVSVKLSDNRGIIYDRNLIPLVGNNPVKYAVIIPELIKDKTEIERLLRQVIVSSDKVNELAFEKPFAEEIISSDAKLLKKLQENNVIIVEGFKRYGDNNFARHIIGYTAAGDDHGRFGIEKAYDEFLFSTQEKSIGIVTDALNNSISGLGVRYTDERGFKGEFSVKLTLDYHIQQIIENCMDRHKISGAVVALRVDDGDIVGMASRPQFDQGNISRYIMSSNSELVNKAVSSFNVGSIFKVVVAAAALESGYASPSETFYCNGTRKVQDRYFRCTASHGLLDLVNAFSVSCNTAFIDLGMKTGKDQILDMAGRFGYGCCTQLSELNISESSGILPDRRYASEKELANIAIGQGDILATPLQVAGMVSCVANGGTKVNMNLIDSIINSDGKIIRKIKYTKRERILSRYTAARLKLMMERVTESGTGKKANIPELGGAAGKTGTAQTGWIQDNHAKVHGWFAGYFPRIKPQYVLVVFVDNGQSGSDVAAPIFGEIAGEIMKLGER